MKPKFLSCDQILSSKLKTRELDIPEWGGTILIREPTAIERADFELLSVEATKSNEVMREIRGYCAVKCIVNESGKRMFTDEQIPMLNELSANALDRVIDVYRDMSLTEDIEIQETAKN
ncbi:MAG: hypothetical protein ACC657_05585 [Thiohalomonadales bacterium]